MLFPRSKGLGGTQTSNLAAARLALTGQAVAVVVPCPRPSDLPGDLITSSCTLLRPRATSSRGGRGRTLIAHRSTPAEIAQLSGRLCPLLTAFVGIRISPRVLRVRISPRASGSGGLCRLDLTALTPTEKTSCLSRELQQEKLVVVDLRHGVSRGCCSDKYFSTDSHAAVNYVRNTEL